MNATERDRDRLRADLVRLREAAADMYEDARDYYSRAGGEYGNPKRNHAMKRLRAVLDEAKPDNNAGETTREEPCKP